MPRNKYKKYLEYKSKETIPKSTAVSRRMVLEQDEATNVMINEVNASFSNCNNMTSLNVDTTDCSDFEEELEQYEQRRDTEVNECEVNNIIIGDHELCDAVTNNINAISNPVCNSADSDNENESINDIYENKWLYNVIQDNYCYDDEGVCDDKDSDDEPNEFRQNNRVHEEFSNMKNIEDSYLQNVLCPCTKTTVGEALLLYMTVAQRHSLTWVTTIDMLKLINVLFNKNAVPTTKYKLISIFLQKWIKCNII
ncbi:uncharacterized protein LOC105181487 [Harpegnathos saltator]|uniref:Uncharacterized protein n=1 Tax=Harpegnathos saltator TaxID=610380 RepID=E2BD52_HARSA|nr:uncharacterized protein LOC105181487 [Harpegnathos saltator]EFN86378.1 hypothetical protein EAI_06105 [Harpegnathos saltator]